MNTMLRRHWKLGAAAFTCSFAVILAACALALPRLSPNAGAALAERLQSRVSPSLRALLLTPVAQPARKEAQPVEIEPATAAASEPATGQVAVASAADAEEAAQLARLDMQFRALKEREASLDAEIKRSARSVQEQSRQELTPSPASPPVPSQRKPTPEEIVLREKIEQTKGKLAALLAYDTDQHPDVVSTQEELLTLEGRLQQLEIERWGNRETTVEAATATSAKVKVVQADAKVLEALEAARTAIEQQVVQVGQERRAMRASLADERAATAEAQPARQAARLPPDVQAPTPPPAPPRLTWIGGLALGSPFAFLLSLLVAMSAIMIAEYSQLRVRTAAFRDSSLHPSS